MSATPVIVGVGEVTQRSKDLERALEPLALMEAALEAAQGDAGAQLLPRVDSLDVVCEHSWPYADAPGLLSARLGVTPTHSAYAPAGGESPVRLIHEAALRIARGECRVAAVVGAEANYSVAAAHKAGVDLTWSPRDRKAKLLRGADICHPVAVKHGVVAPTSIYPLYENASAAAWGQTPQQAQAESAALWSRYAAVAERNPYAWLRQRFSADEIATPTEHNRRIAWPYTLRMVANPLVNMGAAVLLTTLEHARELGVPESRLVHVWGGAAANEPRDFLARDSYAHSTAQEAVLEAALALVGRDARAFEMLELYSCFPVVPKMARRTLGLPADAQMTSTGGLSFFGAPLNNYMTHAAAGLVRALRVAPGSQALLYGQGEYVTKHHALVLASHPRLSPLRGDYSVQAEADRRRGEVPELVLSYTGPATVETHTVLYSRDGDALFGVVIARTPQGQRLMARVPPHDTATLALLTQLDRSPIGAVGEVSTTDNDLLEWKARP